MILDTPFWLYLVTGFSLLSTFYWFYQYFSLFAYSDEEDYPYSTKKTSLIVPIYNEEESRLIDMVNHTRSVDNLDEIFFVDDGSDKVPVTKILKRIVAEGTFKAQRVEILTHEKNKGKREAQYTGFQKSTGELIILMDSDTLLKQNAVRELCRPLTQENIAGATATILVKNKNENFLTKCLSSFYWTASHIWRQAPSNLGYLQVTNGQLSAYKREVLEPLMPRYVTQTFLGVKCAISDDRWIAHHTQIEFGKSVVFTARPENYTYTQNTFKSAYKMLLRWKQGVLREAILLIPNFFKAPVLVLDVWFNVLVTFMQFIIRIIAIYSMFIYPPFFFIYLLGVVAFSLYYALYMLIYNPKDLPYRIAYSILNEIFFSWVFIHAILTIRNQGKWGTRV